MCKIKCDHDCDELERTAEKLAWPISSYCPGMNEEKHENLTQGSWCPIRDLNWVPPEYKSDALFLL
jgi:hypothetical protein